MNTISERHRMSLEVGDVEVVVYGEGQVELSFELPDAVHNFVMSMQELTMIAEFVEKHGDVSVFPERAYA